MQKIIIENISDANQRLDKFIKKFLPNAPLGAIYKMLRTGKIKVSGKKKDQTYRLLENDEIEFFLSDEEVRNFQTSTTSPTSTFENPINKPTSTKNGELRHKMANFDKSKIELDILYQDDDILVINKSFGINVHPGDHKSQEVSLIEMVHDYLWDKYNSLTFKPSLVHRIDRDTTWCLIIALKKNILEDLLRQLQNHKIQKIYHTIIIGKINPRRATITHKLLRNENAKNEAKVIVHPNGQKAITHYQTLKEFSIQNNDFSLLECRIETGRTHQIRVHLSYENCPILGDKAYWNKQINSFMKRKFDISRQLLHSYSLEFFHPWKKKNIKIIAPYKSDMQNILKNFTK